MSGHIGFSVSSFRLFASGKTIYEIPVFVKYFLQSSSSRIFSFPWNIPNDASPFVNIRDSLDNCYLCCILAINKKTTTRSPNVGIYSTGATWYHHQLITSTCRPGSDCYNSQLIKEKVLQIWAFIVQELLATTTGCSCVLTAQELTAITASLLRTFAVHASC